MFHHVFYNELHKKTVLNKDKKDKSKIERSFEIHCVLKNFTDKKTFTIKLKNSCPSPEDWDERIVAHVNGETQHSPVADEAQLVRDHMISGARVGHCKTTVR